VKVTLLDTATGATLETGDEYDPYWWAEGNGSCDCNRAIRMGVETGKPEGICEGSHRFLIVSASDKTYSLKELNEDYPTELLRAFRIA